MSIVGLTGLLLYITWLHYLLWQLRRRQKAHENITLAISHIVGQVGQAVQTIYAAHEVSRRIDDREVH